MVWDLPIRIFHWLLVLSICGSFITIQNDWMLAHEKCGLTILGLLAFRLIWGIIGYPTARFAQFVKGPRAIFAYLHQLIGREKVYSFGHNPIGAFIGHRFVVSYSVTSAIRHTFHRRYNL